MSLFIEDSPRNNVAKWSSEAPAAAGVRGVVLSPFTSPRTATTYKQSLQQTIERLRDSSLDVYIDPTSHALQMPGVGDVRYYDDYNLWSGRRGEISSEADRREHLRRVFELQDRYEVPRLAPTALLHAPTSTTSTHALAMAHEAIEICGQDGVPVMLTIAGSGSFWSGASLDAHVGAMAQAAPSAGWFVVQAHATNALPPPTPAAEVHGLCRTVRSLSELSGFVHISHGDFAGLPAVAAGATSVGTGWDTRQRVCAYTSYVARDPDDGGGGWFKRPTMQHLCGFLTRQEAEVVHQANATLTGVIAPGGLHADQVQVAFDHHVRSLGELVSQVRAAGDARSRFDDLAAIYERAFQAWQSTSAHVSPASDAADWVTPLNEGLLAYARTEGWR